MMARACKKKQVSIRERSNERHGKKTHTNTRAHSYTRRDAKYDKGEKRLAFSLSAAAPS